jgi:hypothetical protein
MDSKVVTRKKNALLPSLLTHFQESAHQHSRITSHKNTHQLSPVPRATLEVSIFVMKKKKTCSALEEIVAVKFREHYWAVLNVNRMAQKISLI